MAASAASGELIMRCFHARTVAHVLHLKTLSYAAHKALQELYEGIVPLVDSFAEAYQGEYGLISNYSESFKMVDDGLELMQGLAEWIDENRDDVCDETYCQNIIDEILALVRSTQYKLKFLE